MYAIALKIMLESSEMNLVEHSNFPSVAWIKVRETHDLAKGTQLVVQGRSKPGTRVLTQHSFMVI